MSNEVLRMEKITTFSGGTKILDNAGFNLYEEEIVGITGLNYAGKTTLIGGITGLFPYTAGNCWYYEEPVRITSVEEARALGIFYIQPVFSLIQGFSITDNIFLKKENKGGILIKNAYYRRRADEVMDLLKFHIDQDTLIDNLSYAEKILVEIGKAVVNGAKIIVLDSLLGALPKKSSSRFMELFQILRSLHISIVLIEPNQRLLKPHCERLFVIRKGRTVGVLEKDEMEENRIISLMLGYEINDDEDFTVKPVTGSKEVLLSLKKIYFDNILRNLTMDIYRNEILGVLNVNKNSGQAIEKILSGTAPAQLGTMCIEGKKVRFKNTSHAMANGIAVVTEEENLCNELTLEENILLSAYKKNSYFGGILKSSELRYLKDKMISEYIKPEQQIVPDDARVSEGWLMGKKVVFSKALASKPKLMVFMNPTQRIDVISKEEIYEDIRSLKKQGITTLIISSDIYEIISVCERLLVIQNGKVQDNVIVDKEAEDVILKKYGKFLKDL